MLTLAAPAIHTAEIKKSRFIARAARVESREQAAAYLTSVREAKANHNAWAFKLGSDSRTDDDGEVGGTAGRPILRAIDGRGLDRVIVVVTRYFGGIKLGAGGLMRAYGGVAAECLRLAHVHEVRPQLRLEVCVPFTLTGALYAALDKASATRLGEHYDNAGVVVEVSIDASTRDAFERAITDATRGSATIEALGALTE